VSLSLIVAMTEERVIGLNNQLPWHIHEDLKRFKLITMGHPVIMGRKTFESIGRPLPRRDNIVVTRNRDYRAEGVRVANSLEEALRLCDSVPGEKFVIGGAALFESSLPIADKLYLTLIHHRFKGDIHFPLFDMKKLKIIEQSDHVTPPPQSFAYSFITGIFN